MWELGGECGAVVQQRDGGVGMWLGRRRLNQDTSSWLAEQLFSVDHETGRKAQGKDDLVFLTRGIKQTNNLSGKADSSVSTLGPLDGTVGYVLGLGDGVTFGTLTSQPPRAGRDIISQLSEDEAEWMTC